MKVFQLLREGEKRLAPSPDAKWDARALLEYALDVPRGALVRSLSDEADPQGAERYLSLIGRRADGEPAQYILGTAWFMGLTYAVDARVLIPRQDTELLCEEALRAAKRIGAHTALDLCTGSGALAVALAKLGGLAVTATDISPEALDVARANAVRNGVSIRFLQGDLLNALPAGERFDLIVCNPPYLSQRDMVELQPEVRREPALALLGGEDGLDFYRRLAQGARGCLATGGALLMEIGAQQGASVPELFEKGWRTRVQNDLNGLARVVEAIPIGD